MGGATITDAGNRRSHDDDSRNRIFWLFISIGVGQFIAVCVIFGLTDGLWRDFGIAASAGIATAAAWWALFARYAERRAERLLSERLDTQGKIISEQVVDTTRLFRNLVLPRDIYADTNGFDLRLNHDLTNNLRHSKTYQFYGPTGIYVPARIRLRPDETRVDLEQVEMIVVDPRNELALGYAIEDRRRRGVASGTDAAIREGIRDDIYMMLIGLWKSAEYLGQARIAYESTAVFKRAEIFEDAAYSSIIGSSEHAEFPLTCAWGKGQPTYARLGDEFDRRKFDSAFVISRATTLQTLEAYLDETLAFSPSRVDEMWERYRQTNLARMEEMLPKAENHRCTIPLPNPADSKAD